MKSSAPAQGPGFDSFEGLPEDWHTGFQKGHFAQRIPAVRPNVELHTGLFSKTLRSFAAENQQPVAFMHVDCDLYSSTKEVFRCLGGLIFPGTVIVFDEYFNHPTWRQDEWLVFQEFVRDQLLSYKYIGYVASHQQGRHRIGSGALRLGESGETENSYGASAARFPS